MRYIPGELGYPPPLEKLSSPPVLTTSGPLDRPGRAVAIVGSREPLPEALRFTHELARTLARAGVTILSGGALGVDGAAHEAALEHGATWCIAPSGRDHVFPREHDALFARIAASKRSRMLWPFADDQPKTRETPTARNLVLVALADVVVVVQARYQSGSRNAVAHARRLGRPVWVVPAAPWCGPFQGSLFEIARGANVLCDVSQLFRVLGLGAVGRTAWPVPRRSAAERFRAPRGSALLRPNEAGWDDAEKTVFSILSNTAAHVDEIVGKTELSTSATITALLTLSLKDVVVEGPDGFFRRRSAN